MCVCVNQVIETVRNEVKDRVEMKLYIKQMKSASDILIMAKKRIHELNVAETF